MGGRRRNAASMQDPSVLHHSRASVDPIWRQAAFAGHLVPVESHQIQLPYLQSRTAAESASAVLACCIHDKEQRCLCAKFVSLDRAAMRDAHMLWQHVCDDCLEQTTTLFIIKTQVQLRHLYKPLLPQPYSRLLLCKFGSQKYIMQQTVIYPEYNAYTALAICYIQTDALPQQHSPLCEHRGECHRRTCICCVVWHDQKSSHSGRHLSTLRTTGGPQSQRTRCAASADLLHNSQFGG